MLLAILQKLNLALTRNNLQITCRTIPEDTGKEELLAWCENHEFCIKNEKMCITNEKLCIRNEEFCIKNDEFCRCEERFGTVVLLEMCEDNDEAIKMYEDKAALTSRQQQLIARSKHAGFSCRCRHLLIYQAPACFTLIRSQSLLLCRPVLTEEDPKYAGPFASELTDIGAQIAAKEEQIWIEMMRRDPEMLRSVSMEES